MLLCIRRERLKTALLKQAQHFDFCQLPKIAQLPEALQHYRLKLGEQLYGGMGFGRVDSVSGKQSVLRYYEFFGAPVVGIVCMDQELGYADALSVGIYLQTLILSLTARGLGTCAQVSLAAYPEVIRSELNIPPELLIICGLAVGYTDPDFPPWAIAMMPFNSIVGWAVLTVFCRLHPGFAKHCPPYVLVTVHWSLQSYNYRKI